jgi:hypothetical protein
MGCPGTQKKVKSMSYAVRQIVVARNDGRGGVHPFGTYKKGQAGYTVAIGDKKYTVGKDGRLNIPKKVMDEYGIIGKGGRRTIEIVFAWHGEGGALADVGATIATPHPDMKNAETGDIARGFADEPHLLEPADSGDYNWSPLE